MLQDLEKGLLGFSGSWGSCLPKMKVLSQEIRKLWAFKSNRGADILVYGGAVKSWKGSPGLIRSWASCLPKINVLSQEIS